MMNARKIRVLHVTAMYPTAEKPSFGVFVKSQVESLRNLADVELFIIPAGDGAVRYVRALSALLKRIEQGYDIIHVHYGDLASLVKLFYHGDTPVVTSYCGSDLNGNSSRGWIRSFKNLIFRDVNRYLSRQDSLSIAKSKELASRIEGRSPAVAVFPNGVDTGKFQPANRMECRKQLGWEIDKPTILFPANTHDAQKNFPLLRNALEAAGTTRCNLVTFEGASVSHDEVPLYLNASDLVVITSLREGSPNIVKEAMACNCRIFSTDCGDVAWLLEGATGSRIVPWPQESWNDAIRGFLDSAGDRESSRSRMALIEKGLDLESVASKLIDLYEKVLEERG